MDSILSRYVEITLTRFFPSIFIHYVQLDKSRFVESNQPNDLYFSPLAACRYPARPYFLVRRQKGFEQVGSNGFWRSWTSG